MIALELSVPIACWKRGHAREFLETEFCPPPATGYGSLLSLVGETALERHAGCRISTGVIPGMPKSTVLRTLWRVKDKKVGLGNKENARPDYQELITGSRVIIFCDRGNEANEQESLEQRVRSAFHHPEHIRRFGGWSLGESTHLINDARLLTPDDSLNDFVVFRLDPHGDVTVPVWVDHVGSSRTRYAVGTLRAADRWPEPAELPEIRLP